MGERLIDMILKSMRAFTGTELNDDVRKQITVEARSVFELWCAQHSYVPGDIRFVMKTDQAAEYLVALVDGQEIPPAKLEELMHACAREGQSPDRSGDA